MASGTAANGYVRSMTGLTFPDSRYVRMTARSSLRGRVSMEAIVWLTTAKTRAIFAMPTKGAIQLPSSGPPTATRIPFGTSTRLMSDRGPVAGHVDHHVVPLTGLNEVLARVVDDPVGEPTMSTFRELHTPATSAPSALAICTEKSAEPYR
jgi:hypothetical protein